MRKGRIGFKVYAVLVVLLLGLTGCGQAPAPSGDTGAAPASQTPAGQGEGQAEAPDQPSQSFAGQTLRVALWGGSWKDYREKIVADRLVELTGAKVEFVVGNPQQHLAKLIASKGQELPFDVMELEDVVQVQAHEMGLLEPLDPARIPNLKDLPEVVALEDRAAFQTIENGITYNAKKYEELGLPKPTRWEDLFHPKLAGRVTIPTLSVSVAPFLIEGLALNNGGNVQNVEPAFEKLKDLDALYYYQSSADLATKFTQGEVWVAAWHSSQTARVADTGFPVEFAPISVQGKTTFAGDTWVAIVKGTKVKELAEIYVNLSLDPQAQLEWSRYASSRPTSRKAMELVMQDPQLSKVEYVTRKEEEIYRPDWVQVAKDFPKWQDLWNRSISQ